MKLIITQPEIEAIVRAHVENTVQLREGAEMNIDFTATRSDDGITATIDIPYLGVAGIPAIAAAIAAEPAPTSAKPAGKTRVVSGTKSPAAEVLGGGTTAATASAKNPEPANEKVASGSVAEVEAEAEAADAQDADAAASDAAAAAAAASRGPSLFGSAFRAG